MCKKKENWTDQKWTPLSCWEKYDITAQRWRPWRWKVCCISAECCYSPLGPKSDSLCWCSNSKLGHFHTLEFLPKWWKGQSIPRGCSLFNTWEHGTSYSPKILDTSTTEIMEQAIARSAPAQKNRLLNLIKFCTWRSVTWCHQLLRERGRCFAFVHSRTLSASDWHSCSLGKVRVALGRK